MAKKEFGHQLWDGASLAKAREKQSETLNVETNAKISSAQRDEQQELEAFDETAALQSAEMAIGRLLGYRARGFLSAEQADHFAKGLEAQLTEHRKATTDLETLKVGWTESTSTDIERGSVHRNRVTPQTMTPESRKQSGLLNWRLAKAIKAIEKLLGELEQAVGQGSRNRDDERDRLSEEAGDHALQSSEDRDYQERLRVNDEVWKLQTDDLLGRNQAGIEARESSARHNQVEEDFSSQMWNRAMSLAQMYDSSIATQLQYLLQKDRQVNVGGPQPDKPQAPLHDHSSEYID
jgi:hypothetical protein